MTSKADEQAPEGVERGVQAIIEWATETVRAFKAAGGKCSLVDGVDELMTYVFLQGAQPMVLGHEVGGHGTSVLSLVAAAEFLDEADRPSRRTIDVMAGIWAKACMAGSR